MLASVVLVLTERPARPTMEADSTSASVSRTIPGRAAKHVRFKRGDYSWCPKACDAIAMFAILRYFSFMVNLSESEFLPDWQLENVVITGIGQRYCLKTTYNYNMILSIQLPSLVACVIWLDSLGLRVIALKLFALDIGGCNPSPCMNGATCVPDGTGTSSCTCPIEWTGLLCESRECKGVDWLLLWLAIMQLIT